MSFLPPNDRRGRSKTKYIFQHRPHDAPLQASTDFHYALADQISRVLDREDNDAVYRGDIKPHEACAPPLPQVEGEEYTVREGSLVQAVREPSLVPTERVPSPEPTVREPSLVPTERVPSPEPSSSQGSMFPISPGSFYASGRTASPTASDYVRRPFTYAKRHRERARAERAAERLLLQRSAQSVKTPGPRIARPRKKYPKASRSSQRLRGGINPEASLDLTRVVQMQVVLISPLAGQIRPFTDRSGFVVGVYAAGPHNELLAWHQLIERAGKAMKRVSNRGDFTSFGDDSVFLRAGIDFGVRGPWPHPVVNLPVNRDELLTLIRSDDMRVIAAYQNDLLQRFMPRKYAHQQLMMQQLDEKELSYPAFPGSPFTTAEFNFNNIYSVMTDNPEDEFGSVRALTVLGVYGVASAWLFYWPANGQDRMAIRCPPGTTLLIPASIVRYAFSALYKGETRYLVQQYYIAALGRWIQNGFRSDTDFQNLSTDEEWEAHEVRRLGRVESVMRSFSKVDELYV
ncbi:hypothetical protein C8R43DRAFT_945717 [Mycena crocata]|nr:hypothetical protein C8R43DRAFT_945717 [Mycena crocata]